MFNADFLNNHPFQEKAFQLTPDVHFAIPDNLLTVNSLSLRSDAVKADVKGTLDGSSTVELEGDLSTQFAVLKKELKGILPSVFPDRGLLSSAIEIQGNLEKTLNVKGEHTVKDARIIFPPSPGEKPPAQPAILSLAELTALHDVDYSTAQDNLILKSLTVNAPSFDLRGSGTVSQLSKDLSTKAEGNLSLDMPGVLKLVKDLLPEGVTAKGEGTITFAGEGSLSPPDGQPLLSAWDGNGSLLVEMLDYAGIGALQDVRSTKLVLKKGVLDAVLECLLNNGPSQVKGTVDFTQEKPDVRVTLEAKDVVLSQDVTLLGYIVPIMINSSEGQLSGKGDFSAKASWQGFSWDADISRTITGEGTLSLREGALKSQNVLSQILKASQQPEVFQFEQILTGFRLSEGRIYNDDIQVNGKGVDLNIRGWTSLRYDPSKKGNPLEYSVAGDVIQRSLGRDAKKIFSALGAEEGTIPVVIGGTVQKPRVVIKMPKAQDLIRGIFKTPRK